MALHNLWRLYQGWARRAPDREHTAQAARFFRGLVVRLRNRQARARRGWGPGR